MSETIPIAADHAGFELKKILKAELAREGFQPLDLGTNSTESTDYPDFADVPIDALRISDFAHALAGRVESGEFTRGVLLCGTGLGMAVAANRHPHVRAAVAWTPEVARLSRAHNDANVLVLPARLVSQPESLEILRAWLGTAFEGGRHGRRVQKIEP